MVVTDSTPDVVGLVIVKVRGWSTSIKVRYVEDPNQPACNLHIGKKWWDAKTRPRGCMYVLVPKMCKFPLPVMDMPVHVLGSVRVLAYALTGTGNCIKRCVIIRILFCFSYHFTYLPP
jgi:hypothetical protein